jgi:peptidoglycan/LPS O-acetylase OafA/YrhL
MQQKVPLAPLTGLRGVAAFAVLIGHALDTTFVYSGQTWWQPFSTRLAVFGMSLFFVLSGFVIAYNYIPLFTKEPPLNAIWQFFGARFARLYPLYVVSLLVMGIVHIPSPFFTGPTFLSYLTLTQSWFNVQNAAFAPDWSLSTEWFFYCTFVPIVLLLPQVKRPVRALIVSAALCGVLLAVLLGPYSAVTSTVVQTFFWHNDQVSATPLGWARYFSPYVRWPEFLLGLLAARAFVLDHRIGWAAGYAGLAWCAAVLFITPISESRALNGIMPNFIFAPGIAFVALACCQREGWLSRLLSSRLAMFAGEISFSVYIWSWAVMRLLGEQFRAPAPSQMAFINSTFSTAAIVLLTPVFAYGSYVLIEMPSRRWLRRQFAEPIIEHATTVSTTSPPAPLAQ